MQINLYTDGAARGNPGPGGYGIVLEYPEKNYRKEFAEGFKHTTNNRMELRAVIEGLKKLKTTDLQVTVYTDSRYVADAVEKKWVFGWERKQFKDRKNADLWKELLEQIRTHSVKFVWIKGHNNHPQNERCDALAVAASKQQQLKEDIGFTESSPNE
ncbi:MAG: ribonuclease HI [Flavobacteriaceae bacterium]|jgi:ribonuclease HI|nr:ribonuclease HI [Flavobacteriaceae bacterium]